MRFFYELFNRKHPVDPKPIHGISIALGYSLNYTVMETLYTMDAGHKEIKLKLNFV